MSAIVLEDHDVLEWGNEPGWEPARLLVREGALWFAYHDRPWHEPPHYGLTLREAEDVINGKRDLGDLLKSKGQGGMIRSGTLRLVRKGPPERRTS